MVTRGALKRLRASGLGELAFPTEELVAASATTVLLIEDNPGDARYIRQLLGEAVAGTFDLDYAGRLSAGLERLRAPGVDVVLLDLLLPDSTGLETFRLVHAAAREIPVVVLSELNDEALALEAVHEGAQDYLIKGQTDGALLRRVLRYAIERGQLLAAEQAARAEAESARGRAEAARQRANLLDQASEVLAESLDYELTLQRVAELMVKDLARYCSIEVVQRSGALWRVAVAAAEPSEQERLRSLLNYPPDPGRPHPAWRVLRTGSPEILSSIPDALLGAAAHDSEHLALLRSLDLGSAVLVPMQAHARMLGVIQLIWPVSLAGDPSDLLEVARALAYRAALAVDNARSHRELEEAMRAREAFFAAVTHDLRNPLSSMTLWVDTLALTSQSVAAGTQAASVMARAVERLQDLVSRSVSLVDEVLDVSRLEAGRPLVLARSEVDLVALASLALEARRGQTPHELSLKSPEIELRGWWDASRLRRVLDNLVDNAIKYSAEAGPVTVRVNYEESDGRQWATVEVEDHGVGIPAADLPRIFERFYRAPNVAPRAGGVGLGLWGSRQIIEQHGGSLSVTSQECEGSTFTIRLPVADV
jgi:signal transduction histidine kinase/DNA-binding NarL/FixJ family response regulator